MKKPVVNYEDERIIQCLSSVLKSQRQQGLEPTDRYQIALLNSISSQDLTVRKVGKHDLAQTVANVYRNRKKSLLKVCDSKHAIIRCNI